MSRLLQIRDNQDVVVYDLLTTRPSIDLGSRQLAPMNMGRWQETFSLFAGSAQVAQTISASVFDLDVVVKSINDYGESPAYNSPIWLYEKSDGELTQARRAPLFSASQQPIVNGAVGPLLINNGYIGLLTIERGDWENVTAVSSVQLEIWPDIKRFGQLPVAASGSVNGRMGSIGVLSTNIATSILSFGSREANFGTANFQPCVNWGATPTTPVTRVTDSFATSPYGQPAPVGNAITLSFWIGTPNETYLMPLSAVSLSSLDTVNRDYVGEYTAFLRYGLRQIGGANTYYIKYTIFYGYEGEYVYNDPVYIPANQSPISAGYYYHGINVGNIKIPTGVYHDFGGTAETLADFTFGINWTLVGTQDGTVEVFTDSLILVPAASATITDVNDLASPTGLLVETEIVNTPYGSSYVKALEERFTGEFSGEVVPPVDGGILFYYHEMFEELGGGSAPTRELSTQEYPRYNSLGGS